jgi:HPt (histidine-containing phosphotransfer) domain-containing protein
MTSSRDREPAIGGAPDVPLMDLVHLRSFTDGDAQLEQELGALYLATADLYLARMAAALEGGHGGGGDWSSAAHALKGASANLGARRVAALAAAAERAPAEPDRLAALRRAIEEVRAFFERGRG